MMYEELRGDLAAWATHFHFNDETSLLLCKAADAIEDLDNRLNLHRQGKIGHWIPVTERLPENGSLIGNLICDSDGQIRIARQCAEIQLKEKTVYTDLIELADLLEEKCPASNWNDCTHITHWMPLPQPPESDGE